MGIAFAIYRVQKLKRGSRGSGTLGQCLRHLRKHKESAEITHPERTSQNHLTGVVDYRSAMRFIDDRIAEHNDEAKKDPSGKARGFRSDASIACEMVFSYSPKVSTGRKNRKGEEILEDFGQSLEYALAYEKKLLQFIREQFPTMKIIAVARHCDEQSYHWHIVATSWDKERKRLSLKDMLGGPGQLKKQQTALADLCEDIGLSRGISKEITKSTHKTKQEHNRIKLLQQKQNEARILEESHRAIEEIFAER